MEEKVSEKHQTLLNIIEKSKESVRRCHNGEKEIDVITNDEEYYIALGMIYQMMVKYLINRPKNVHPLSRPLLDSQTNKKCIKAFINVFMKSNSPYVSGTWQGELIANTLSYKKEEVKVTVDDKINLMIGWISHFEDSLH